MADRKTVTDKKTSDKKTSDKEVSGLMKAFKNLSPTKRKYSELSKSSSTTSVSSGSSFASNPYVTMTTVYGQVPGSSSSGNSSAQKHESRREKEEEAKEKELLQKLQKSVQETSKTLDNNLLFKTFTCWRTLPALNRLKREQDARKARWREKVLQVVPDYRPPED